LDAYLEIAAKILKAERRPLSPDAILRTAYRKALVPAHLHGKTQHKTLQARISEDIVHRRDHSLFFRTEPGRFFLREFLTDQTIPEEFRRPFPARRRFRELVRGPALAIEFEALRAVSKENTPIQPHKIFGLLKEERYRYDDPRNIRDNIVFVRSFVCVYRDDEILTYRIGRYRDDRDNFLSRRSIGFSTFVHLDEHTFFNLDDFGIIDSGIRATKIDLDIPDLPFEDQVHAILSCFIWFTSGSGSTDLLAVINFECPSWFEPLKRRLALNDLAWLDACNPVNDVEDFDPWSKSVLLAHYGAYSGIKCESFPAVLGQAKRRLHQVSNRDW
jgi:hypothetical protein